MFPTRPVLTSIVAGSLLLAIVPRLVCAQHDDPAGGLEHAPAAPADDHASDPGAVHADDHGDHAHIGERDVNRQPQEFRADLAIWTLAVFALLYFGLKKFAWPKIEAALEARESGIRQAVQDAENARRDAQALVAEHKGRMEAIDEEVKAIIAEVRRDAERTKTDIIASAESEARAIKDRSIAEIHRARDQALDELFGTMASQVTAATEHVVGKGVSVANQDQLIDEALREFAAQRS